MSTSSQERHVHHGHNIKKFREMLGIKQEALAIDLGDDWNQKKVSRLEEKEIVEPEILEQVAAVFKVPVDAIKNYDSEKAINIISNTFNDEAVGYTENYKCNFNPLEKMVELYERMISQQAEMIDKLERLIREK
jgi:transcriptional regulator with XRE-family HTH domain